MGPSKRSLNRPKKRTLVRWDENLNELLLLTVQSVCNIQSVKIPWAEVAKTMGHNVTEGAIVQHLAKLRARRAAIGKDVPPPLRRGGIGAAIKPSPSKTSTAPKRKSRNSRSMDSDDESPFPIEYDDSSDEDYTESRRTKRNPKKAKRASSPIKQEFDSEKDNREEGSASSDELLVPGAAFLDYPNDVSEDSSAESNSSPARKSKIVILKYRRHNTFDQELAAQGEVVPAPVLTEADVPDPESIDNVKSEQALGYDFNANMLLANFEPNHSDPLVYQNFETMPEASYITHDSVMYGNPLENHSELPIGMMGHPEFIQSEDFQFLNYQDLLGAEANLDFA
ncbi:hypothetical protein P170DRAFT_475277 [Aspergillus steynii IBT 23096]|uniref:Myb-like domain-containing protein n=1 Tax=Aspergillus steynii IBT 23096 TaxID=1392250 RepID=A0A2I2G7W7_9EURO|nr:uncharacterized protein P170DRAFT_475277 [Aspergillus steynii IBT 23096]PLB48943.1 hypothetical protein P170DRAFT_475277 [Aspergillus steynii IBT 23096]